MLFCFIIFTLSCYFRRPVFDQTFIQSEATYHVLLTMQCYDQTPVSVHKFLPIQTFGDQTNKFIQNGPSLLMDQYGNNYYISFSPLGFAAPYFFCKLFHFSFSVTSIYIFNSLLMLICAILTGIILRKMFHKELMVPVGFLLYIFQPEMMASQGRVYWHQSLTQLFLELMVLLFIYDIYSDHKWRFPFWAICILAFLYPYTEWSGYVFNAGLVLAYFINGISFHASQNHSLKHKNHLLLSKSSLIKSFIILILTGLAFWVYYRHFALNVGHSEIFETLFDRYNARNNSNFMSLLRSYWNSYAFLISLNIIMLISCLCISTCRKRLKEIILSKKHLLIGLIILIPSLENIVMMEHANEYSFDRLKFGFASICLFALLLSSLLDALKWSQIQKLSVLITAVSLLGITNICYHLNSNYYISLPAMTETELLRNYINDNYNANNSIIVKNGGRAWGFLQSYYGRNIFCTDIYSKDQLVKEAEKRKSKYIITLYSDKNKFDTDKTTYSSCLIEDLQSSSTYRIQAKNNQIIINNNNAADSF